MTKMWLLTPEYSSIQVVDIEEPSWDKFKAILKCEWLETQSCSVSKCKHRYTIFMNEDGLENETVPNPCARELLSQLPIWFLDFKGPYLIGRVSFNEKMEENSYHDMNITPQQLVDVWNASHR